MLAEINSLNILMQGRDLTLVGLSEKLKAFKEKLKLWVNKIKARKTGLFPSLNDLSRMKMLLSPKSKTLLRNIYSKFITEFNNYILENAHKYNCMRNPFNTEAEDQPDKMANISTSQEQFIEIQNDDTSS